MENYHITIFYYIFLLYDFVNIVRLLYRSYKKYNSICFTTKDLCLCQMSLFSYLSHSGVENLAYSILV